MAEETAEGGQKAEGAPKKPMNLGLILGGVNMLALLGVLGLLVYTKIIYKRPSIVESRERERIAQEAAAKEKAGPAVKALVKLDPIQANLKPTQIGARTQGGPPPQLKPHFLTMTLAFEITDATLETAVRGQVPKFLDQLLQSLGKTTVDELATVQGRYILRSKIMGIMNGLLREAHVSDTPIVTNVYFSDFTVQ